MNGHAEFGFRKAVTEIERLFSESLYFEAAQRISRLQLWRYGKSSELIRQRDLISNHTKLDDEDLKALIANFLVSVHKEPFMANRIFIVHGWDQELKLATKNYLQNVLGLECLILHEQDSEGETIINKFERYAREAVVAVVLLSDKDNDSPAFGDPNSLKVPRPNVLFEMGYFFARLGRRAVLILRKGKVEINSDIMGIEYIDVTNGVEEAGENIRKRLSWLLTSK